ncbi:hypothetical protein [Flavobacterium sp.]|uniref:hypothetical protein n=1 Tax=Flavobacterium sp. TaxID=239 RepID=UPI00375213D2
MKASSQQKIDDRVFSLASNLFGFGNTEAKKQIEQTIAMENATLQLDNRIIAVYPAIIEEAFSTTMENYRKYIASYNFKTQAENELIEKHNASVAQFCKENELTQIQSEFRKVFVLKKKNLKPRVYNEAVNEFCNDYGLIVEKKKIQSVKYATEIVFQNLLHLYNSQLMKRNEKFIKSGITAKRPIQEFKINSFLVTQLKRKEIHSINICTKTVRNHRQRLEEAGVFTEYHFAGQNKPVEVHINPEILVVLDIKTSKLKNAENKQLKCVYWNLLPDNNENTRTIINEYQKNENVENISQFKRSSGEALTPSYLNFSTRTHTSKEAISNHGARATTVKVQNILSEKLQTLIVHPQELAVNLANGEYMNYKPIDIRHLFKEAFSGTLTNDEFRKLAIQDFFKSISKIYRFSTPFAGSWKKAITLYYQNKWIAFTGNSFNKSVLVDEIQQMRWRMEWARKWFIKNQFPPLFPYDYFDMTRKTSKEVGFEYTKAKWNEHLLSIAKYDALKKKQECNAVRRKETINHAKKCETAVNRFFKNKVTYTQLFDYVEKNLPKQYIEKLPDIILKKSLKDNEKTIAMDCNDMVKYNFFEF